MFNRSYSTSIAATLGVFVGCIAVNLHAADNATNNTASTFERDVASLFVTRCLTCHSANEPAGGLDLTTREALLAGGESGAALEPGDPDSSYLIERLRDGEMPPEGKGQPPTAEEMKRLVAWIARGAKWPSGRVLHPFEKTTETRAGFDWWSLQPLNETRLSESSTLAPDSESQATTIDDFIRARLNKQGLRPSPRADRRTLIRRLSFDLHGLPPTPEAVDSFVNDADPNAYETLVDRMLTSPHYGERFAQHWLDIAHYADTHGFERDRRRDNAWRYRDYVIQALNDDVPYDQFIQEQIAGDVLWPQDHRAVIATGFLAAGPWDYVGQVETKSPVLRRSARSLDLDDMATQVMTSTVAMTLNCARCHDHKLDPISQEEYYRLRAVFAGVKRGDRLIESGKKNQLVEQRLELVKAIDELDPGLDLADIVGGGNGQGTGTRQYGIDPRNARTTTVAMGMFLAEYTPNKFAASDHRFVDGVVIPKGEHGKARVPITSTGITVKGLPGTDGKAWDAIRNGPVTRQFSPKLGKVDFGRPENSLLGLHANAAITFNLAELRTAVARRSESSSKKPDAKSQATLRFTSQVGYFGAPNDGSFADARVYVDGKKVVEFLKLKRTDNLKDIVLLLPADARFLTLMSTDGGNGIGMDQIGFGHPTIKADASRLPPDDQKRLANLRERKRDIESKLAAMSGGKVYAVVPERMPETRVLQRGNPEAPVGDPLEPGALVTLRMLDAKLGEHTSSEGDRRVALAKWITDSRNPLTRRVIVNRLWQWHFGKGLVDTPSDFGFGGGRPSHPELLDWLGDELLRQKWSLKAMHRLIVTSETYKQVSCNVGRALLPVQQNTETPTGRSARPTDIDADNRLLWRQNPRRIEAEAVRDAVLFVSGKLNSERGGPGFEDFKYQEAYAPIYTYITADKPSLWRRSIYRYIVRTTPNRFLTTLDCPDPANLTPQRLTTTTPLQSLALYNNDFMLRQARYFAERIEREAGNDRTAQVERAFALAFGRRPVENEARLATDFVIDQGLFALCRSLFNSNEFVYVD